MLTHSQRRNPLGSRSSRSCRVLALAIAFAYGAADGVAGQSPERARATQGTLVLPSYVEGLPDPNPPFDALNPARINYPYTLRTNLTNQREDRAWRALFLENEYLRCSILPDLGGHLYSCTDKVSGEEMFYANPSIKLTQIGYRGAWAAFGVEFNYPVSHNWMSASPIDFALRDHTDGSASVWIGNIDRVYGTDWRVELKLRPGQAVLEQHTTLHNRSEVRHRYYWWTNAAVRVTDESWVLYPMEVTASHGFTNLDTWPIDARGTDNSLVANHLFGPVSRFSHDSREPFMAVYHPDLDTGVMHYSAPDHLPSKKIWSWGGDERGLDWRRALSDDNSAYVEIQAGVFRNQETYGYLEPQETLQFSEYWTPLRELGGLSRANPAAQVHLCRVDACGQLPSPGLLHHGEGALRVRANVTRSIRSALVRVVQNDVEVFAERLDLDPWTTFDRTIEDGDRLRPFSLIITSGDGSEVIRHTEGVYDYADSHDAQLGEQPVWTLPDEADRTEADVLHAIDELERNGRRHEAWAAVTEALSVSPGNVLLSRVAGRLAVTLGRYDDARPHLESVLGLVSNDTEMWYYLGLARRAEGERRGAVLAFEAALPDARFRAATRLQLGSMAIEDETWEAGLGHLGEALRASPSSARLAALLSAALRAADREGDALELVDVALARFPSHSFLRYEATRLGAYDPSLWAHLAGDPERLLEIVADYLRLGRLEEAHLLLDRTWSDGEGIEREPGQVAPDQYPLLAYTAAYVRALSGLPYEEHLERAARLPLTGVFPNRPQTHAVLTWVVAQQPSDGGAHWLLGALELQRARSTLAAAHWERARQLAPSTPALHRSLGLLYLQSGDAGRAAEVLTEGTRSDPVNMGVYASLDDALAELGRSADDRADALLAYPDLAAMPAALVYRVARRLADAGRFDEADALFRDRFFPREEGGINVRQVYLEVRIARAREAVANGDCGSARRVLNGLLERDPVLEFTSDGLELWLDRANLREEVDQLRATCSNGGVRQ